MVVRPETRVHAGTVLVRARTASEDGVIGMGLDMLLEILRALASRVGGGIAHSHQELTGYLKIQRIADVSPMASFGPKQGLSEP